MFSKAHTDVFDCAAEAYVSEGEVSQDPGWEFYFPALFFLFGLRWSLVLGR